jgi:hypothetical protein
MSQGWKKLSFESGSFGKIDAVLCMDSLLIGMNDQFILDRLKGKTMATHRVSRERAQQPDDPAKESEHRTFRKLLGQLQWETRMNKEAFPVSALSSKATCPTIKNILEANSIMRRMSKKILAAAMTDWKSLYDTLTKERVDKRLSMESAILRNRKLVDPATWRTQQEADELNTKIVAYVAAMVDDTSDTFYMEDSATPRPHGMMFVMLLEADSLVWLGAGYLLWLGAMLRHRRCWGSWRRWRATPTESDGSIDISIYRDYESENDSEA